MRQARSKSFEDLCELALDRAGVHLLNVPRCGGRWIGKGRFIKEKTACDLIGIVRGTGQSFVADAKVCCDEKWFYVNKAFREREHQREELICAGVSGAISGVIVEVTAERQVLWLDWQYLSKVSIAWTEPFWSRLSSGQNQPSFDLVLKPKAEGVEIVER